MISDLGEDGSKTSPWCPDSDEKYFCNILAEPEIDGDEFWSPAALIFAVADNHISVYLAAPDISQAMGQVGTIVD